MQRHFPATSGALAAAIRKTPVRPLQGIKGGTAVELKHQPATHQRAHGSGVGLAFHQVAFPVARHQAIIDLRRTHMDRQNVLPRASPALAALGVGVPLRLLEMTLPEFGGNLR